MRRNIKLQINETFSTVQIIKYEIEAVNSNISSSTQASFNFLNTKKSIKWLRVQEHEQCSRRDKVEILGAP